MKRLIILPFAEIDIKETVSFYKEIGDGLEFDFIGEIDSSFIDILKNPKAFPLVKYDIRKYVMRKFSFSIYYIDRKEALFILSVFHDKRNPKDWLKRRIKGWSDVAESLSKIIENLYYTNFVLIEHSYVIIGG